MNDLPKCKTCGGEFHPAPVKDKPWMLTINCEDCDGTGLDLPTIPAALRLSDRVAKAKRWMVSVDGTGGTNAFILLSDLKESEG